MLKRVVILGPESTGKSTLSAQLAAHYQTKWVPEYARQFLEENGVEYNFDDLLTIAKRQLEMEDEAAASCIQPFLFIDTNMYVMKVWCEFVYGRCHPWILQQLANRTYHMYLLCNIDLPWEYQEMREYPDLESRQRLFHMYKDLLVHQHVPWTIIGGSDKQRLHSAINVVDHFFNSESP